MRRATRTVPILILILVLAACENDDGSSSGTPLGSRTINLTLSYGPGGANYGSQTATGTVVIDTATGRVETTVQGLPQLTNEMYEGWLAGGGESPISTGRFNTDANGGGSATHTLGDISARSYVLFVLTVEPEPDPSPAPDDRHSIGADIPSA